MIGPSMLMDNYEPKPGDYVLYGEVAESHRPPILMIPDKFFKGFMFSSLDQILSMTKEKFQNLLLYEEQKERQQQMKQMRR